MPNSQFHKTDFNTKTDLNLLNYYTVRSILTWEKKQLYIFSYQNALRNAQILMVDQYSASLSLGYRHFKITSKMCFKKLSTILIKTARLWFSYFMLFYKHWTFLINSQMFYTRQILQMILHHTIPELWSHVYMLEASSKCFEASLLPLI